MMSLLLPPGKWGLERAPRLPTLFSKDSRANRYETAWRWFRDGKIKGHRVGHHTIIIAEIHHAPPSAETRGVAIYARVSSAEKKANLESQAERLRSYCMAKGDRIARVGKDERKGRRRTVSGN
ncbi:MAG TPA: recombinase family protein [Ktedonobacteraceae bacterium]|nr:recombinase family protein [Ktedonobacteraceae bacterium]